MENPDKGKLIDYKYFSFECKRKETFYQPFVKASAN